MKNDKLLKDTAKALGYKSLLELAYHCPELFNTLANAELEPIKLDKDKVYFIK